MISKRSFLHAFGAALLAASPQARAVFPQVALKPVVLKQIHSPTTITHAPDGSGRVFVCDQPGKIYIIQNGMMLPTPFLDIASPSNAAPNNGPGPAISVGQGYNERGLLCLTFHPGYSNPASTGYRKFYLNYNKPFVPGGDDAPLGPLQGTNLPLQPPLTGNCVSVIAEFQVSPSDPNVAVPSSERRLLLFTQPQSNHNGGQLEFGPEIGPGGERYLYIGVGDGGSQEDNNLGHTGGDNTTPRPTAALGNAQDKTRLFGKILRIDPLGTNGPGGQYGIPPSNPFVGVGGGVREEIYCYGMRNPWRFSFDKRAGGTNRLFCGDVGGGRTEEVNIIVSGGNYGWRYKEGVELPLFSSGAQSPSTPMTLPPAEVAAMIDPIARYAHQGQIVESPALPQLGLSVTGGFVYRGPAIPALQGKYVFSDYGNTSTLQSWNSPLMGLEETAPNSGVFTLTQAISLLGTANPIVGQRILCLGEDESGEIYVGMKTNAGVLQPGGDNLPAGGIYKIIPLQSFTTTLQAVKDNTIFSDNPPRAPIIGYPSDALGYLYAGRTGTNHGPYVRRALVAFDLAAEVPPPAIIQTAQLKLNLTKIGPEANGTIFSVHRLTETWGEGTSMNNAGAGFGANATVGDATWVRRFFNTSSWTTVGGSFTATASATTTAAFASFLTWASTAALKADVQNWVDTAASNAGWIIRGDEFTNESACQFASKQTGGVPPELQITYEAIPALTRREVWLQTYFPVGMFVDGSADLDGDGITNKFEYAFTFSPLAANPPNSAAQVTAVESGENIVFTINFRRDPRATDLTYILETTSDFVTWTPLVTSAGGADPSGSGYVTESDVIGEEPVRLVTGRETVPKTQSRFARVRVLP